MVDCYLGLGSNVGDKVGYLLQAKRLLGADEGIDILDASRLYRTEPVGMASQDRFVNAVLRISTGLEPRELLQRCHAIERTLKRERRERWGPRTLDIDLLLYGDRRVEEEGLTVPHPRMWERAFVVWPLADLAPDLKLDGISVAERKRAFGEARGIEALIDYDKAETVAVIGASQKPERYAYRAQRLLLERGYSVIPVSPKGGSYQGIEGVARIEDSPFPVHTVTLYLSPEKQSQVLEGIAKRRPRRVIFNPGSESPSSEAWLRKRGIATKRACTLVMLQMGQF